MVKLKLIRLFQTRLSYCVTSSSQKLQQEEMQLQEAKKRASKSPADANTNSASHNVILKVPKVLKIFIFSFIIFSTSLFNFELEHYFVCLVSGHERLCSSADETEERRVMQNYRYFQAPWCSADWHAGVWAQGNPNGEVWRWCEVDIRSERSRWWNPEFAIWPHRPICPVRRNEQNWLHETLPNCKSLPTG